MVYATAGVAWIDYSLKEYFGTTFVSGDFSNIGGTIGLGVEHAFGYRWTARADYSYSDFGEIDEAGAEWDLNTSELRLGVAMHF
jgi:outer membrane immunogenic protein